jgi:glycerol-3-phosphate acyltransferase PlsY
VTGTIAVIAAAYVLGSIPFSILFARAFGGVDPRSAGSRSAGATNVARTVGVLPGVLALLGDAAKGVVAVLILSRLVPTGTISVSALQSLPILAGAAAIIGHLFPVFARFRGGKGVATAAGVLFSLLPLEAAIAFGCFLIAVVISRRVSLGSLVAIYSAALIVGVERFALHRDVSLEMFFFTTLLAFALSITHRGNIARILSGTESRLGEKTRNERSRDRDRTDFKKE